jgi:hypothetical protein
MVRRNLHHLLSRWLHTGLLPRLTPPRIFLAQSDETLAASRQVLLLCMPGPGLRNQ